MAVKVQPRPAKFESGSVPRIAIVASEYNPEFVQALVNHTCKEIYLIDEGAIIELFGAPGSFEIPVVVDMVASKRRHDVIIALGLVMQGRTKHAEFIVQSVSFALQQVALKYSVPVIHEVLLVNNEEEARERCIAKELNRGIEAARAAFAMLRVRHQLMGKPAVR